ncbi:MAG: hypothetical protein ACPGSN_04305 [Psychrobium sp.]
MIIPQLRSLGYHGASIITISQSVCAVICILEELAAGELRELALSLPTTALPLYIAWKSTNRGKGLARLIELLQDD